MHRPQSRGTGHRHGQGMNACTSATYVSGLVGDDADPVGSAVLADPSLGGSQVLLVHEVVDCTERGIGDRMLLVFANSMALGYPD